MNVSVVVPVYNGIMFIDRCITSVLPQLDENDELIIVDDGSSDGTYEFLKDLYRNESPVVLVRLSAGLGVSAARNTGIRLARGDLIAFCDADDEWREGKLEAQISFLNSHPDIQVVFTDDVSVADDVNERTDILVEQAKSDRIHFRCALMRRSVFDEVGLLDEEMRVREDTEWLVRARTKGIAFGFIDEPLYVRHVLSSGLSAGAGDADRKQRVLDSFIKGIRRSHLKVSPNYDLSILIPVFNADKYVAEAVESCVSSKYSYELILADDGSADSSLDTVCKCLRSCNIPTTLIHRKHRGQASSRNDTYRVSRGRYLLYLDADDRFTEGAIDALMDSAADHPDASVISSLCRDFISPDLTEEDASALRINPEPYRRMLSGCMLIQRNTFDVIGLYDEKMATSETAQWVMRIRDAHLKIHEINYITLARRYHRDNLGRVNLEAQMKSYMDMIRARLKKQGQ